MTDPSTEYAHRLSIMLECMLLDPTGTWNEAANLLDEYRSAVLLWNLEQGEPYVSGFGKD